MSKIVVIDAGHGGSDPGAVGGGAKEKDKTLLIAKELAKQFRETGVDTLLTRTEDVDLSLAQRTAMERQSGAACCISCHLDAGPETASGMTVWLHSRAPASYQAWAEDVLKELKQVGYTGNRASEINRGYRGSPTLDYAWNRDTKSPSILLELGFLTSEENRREFDERYREYAGAIVRAACRFIGVAYRAGIPGRESASAEGTDYKTLYMAAQDKLDRVKQILEG